MRAWMQAAARIKNKPLGKHNNCPVQKMPPSHNLSAALQTQEPLASPILYSCCATDEADMHFTTDVMLTKLALEQIIEISAEQTVGP